MTDQIVTAQPAATPAPGGDAVPAQQTGIAAPATPIGPAPVAPARQLTLDEQLEAVWEKSQQPKEQPAKTEPAPIEAAPEEADKEITTDQPKEAAPIEPAQSPAIAAPHSWSAEQKAKWAVLPPETQKYIAQRESEAHQQITRQGNELRQFAPLREVYQAINSWGVPAGREAEVITSWARAQATLDRNPVEGLKWLAQSYNVDLAQLAGEPQPAKKDEAIDDLFRDPRLDAIAPKVGELQNTISQLQRQLASREAAEAAARQRQAETIIQTFASDKPDWDEVAEEVIAEIAVIRQASPELSQDQILQKAYDRARWANPVIRERILADQRRAEQESQSAEAKRKAEEAAKLAAQKAQVAKKISSMNVRTGATASTPTFDGRWDDNASLNALYDRIQSGS